MAKSQRDRRADAHKIITSIYSHHLLLDKLAELNLKKSSEKGLICYRLIDVVGELTTLFMNRIR